MGNERRGAGPRGACPPVDRVRRGESDGPEWPGNRVAGVDGHRAGRPDVAVAGEETDATAVLIVLSLIVVVGGGRKLLHAWRARGAVERLGADDVSAAEVEAAVAYGRDGLMDLFRLLADAESAEVRHAAGHAISVLWARDDLIAEEEKALVRRGFHVSWRGRRRYPRGLRGAIPIDVAYGVPFLRDDGRGIRPENLEWSHTIQGSRRAAMETPSPWRGGPGLAEVRLIPGDFETNGPHKLAIQARVRTTGLTGSWELELPHIPFSFEFDPLLNVVALFNQADAARGEAIARAVRLGAVETGSAGNKGATYLDLNATMALRDPPSLSVTTPLPCDLSHAIEIEFEGFEGRFGAGSLILSGQGTKTAAPEPATIRHYPLGPIARLPEGTFDRPGRHRLRAILVADADRGWGDPDIRSIWPDPIVTDWVEVEVVRR